MERCNADWSEVGIIINKEEKIMIEFVSTEVGLPPYGAPVLIKTSNGVVQHITYMRDGADNCSDDCADWFEPYHFPHDDELKIPLCEVAEWALLSVLGRLIK